LGVKTTAGSIGDAGATALASLVPALVSAAETGLAAKARRAQETRASEEEEGNPRFFIMGLSFQTIELLQVRKRNNDGRIDGRIHEWFVA
jgi:hypothetical protein